MEMEWKVMKIRGLQMNSNDGKGESWANEGHRGGPRTFMLYS